MTGLFTPPTDIAAVTKALSVDINNLSAAIEVMDNKLPTEAEIKRGTINFAVDTGAADAYLVALPYTPSGYVDGLEIVFRPLNANTGAATVNVNSLGVKSLKRADGSALSAGDIAAGSPVVARYSTATGFFHTNGNSAVDAAAAAASAVAAAASASAANSSAGAASTSETNAAASAALAASIAAGILATSTTSLLIAVASKSFTTQASKLFAAGQWVTAASAADPANYMHGQVTSYSGTTLVVNVTNVGGAGTLADWNISISGTRGAIGVTGATGPESFPVASAGGTVDAITATYSPAITLADQQGCRVVLSGANTSTTPTFAPNGLTARTITKKGGVALDAGDLPGANAVAILQYNLANTRWELLNPANQIAVGFRNRVINGCMRIDQRNGGAAQTITAAAALAYTVDRFYAYCTGANVTGQQVAGASQTQKRYQFTGAASVTAIGFGTRLEARNTYDLNSQTVTISADLANSLLTTVTWTLFRATTSDDTFGTLASPTVTQVATGTFTVNSTVTRYSAQAAVTAASTTGLQLVFSVGAQTSGTWTIGNVQLETGSVATVFEQRPFETELLRCQRYLEKSYNVNVVPATATSQGVEFFYGSTDATGVGLHRVVMKVPKRATPTVVTYTDAGASGNWGYARSGASGTAATTIDLLAENSFRVYLSTGGGAWSNGQINGHWTATAEL